MIDVQRGYVWLWSLAEVVMRSLWWPTLPLAMYEGLQLFFAVLRASCLGKFLFAFAYYGQHGDTL